MASGSSSPYYKRLLERVEEVSGTTLIKDPDLMTRWFLHRYEVSREEQECVCGKKNIKHLYFMRMKSARDDGDSELLVGSECVNQFKEPRAVALMNLLSRGVAVEFIKREAGRWLVFKLRTKAGQNMFREHFPEAMDDGYKISMEDRDKKVQRGHSQAGVQGKMKLKLDLDEEFTNFFIIEFTVTKLLKRVKEAPWSTMLTIDGIRYSAAPRRNMLSKYPSYCKMCQKQYVVGDSRIMPCDATNGRGKTLWVCYSHVDGDSDSD